jgi:hypothetical protein
MYKAEENKGREKTAIEGSHHTVVGEILAQSLSYTPK